MCNKGLHMLKDMILKRPDGRFREGLANDTSFARVCYFVDGALGIMGRRRGLESPVRCGFLYIGSTSVDVCSNSLPYQK